ncbi:MAG: hypothetical protein ACLP1Y_16945 [Candidatus Acidiferrales bacterium]
MAQGCIATGLPDRAGTPLSLDADGAKMPGLLGTEAWDARLRKNTNRT